MKKLMVKSVLVLGATGLMAFAQATPQSSTPPPQGTQTATTTDSQMSSQVRQAIMNDNVTQPAAHSVHVSTKNGMVTLKGKVSNAQEKDAIEAHAKQIAGDSNVKNEITVTNK